MAIAEHNVGVCVCVYLENKFNKWNMRRMELYSRFNFPSTSGEAWENEHRNQPNPSPIESFAIDEIYCVFVYKGWAPPSWFFGLIYLHRHSSYHGGVGIRAIFCSGCDWLREIFDSNVVRNICLNCHIICIHINSSSRHNLSGGKCLSQYWKFAKKMLVKPLKT